MTIDITRVGLTVADGRHKSGLDIAVFCQNADGDGIGDLWQKMDLNLSEPTYQRMLRDGLTYRAASPSPDSSSTSRSSSTTPRPIGSEP